MNYDTAEPANRLQQLYLCCLGAFIVVCGVSRGVDIAMEPEADETAIVSEENPDFGSKPVKTAQQEPILDLF